MSLEYQLTNAAPPVRRGPSFLRFQGSGLPFGVAGTRYRSDLHYVAFVDILGFAQQVESLDSEGFQAICKYWEQRILPPFHSPAYKLTRTYETFQRYFDGIQQSSALEGRRRSPTGVVDSFLFSDSAFIATTDALDLLMFCRHFVRMLMNMKIPVRRGVGAGSFASFDIETRRAAGGHVFVRCPFLGSAVVRAYRAESSGLRGLRCFVHPSFVAEAPPEAIEELVELDEPERRLSASHELDLFWFPGVGVGLHEVDEAIKSLSEMRKESPQEKAQYYEESLAAYHRMWKRQLDSDGDSSEG